METTGDNPTDLTFNPPVEDAPTDTPPGTGFGSAPSDAKVLRRDTSNKMLGGVCSGVARFFNVDVTLVRFLAIAGTFAFGMVLPLYLAAWLVVPAQDTGRSQIENLLNKHGESANNNTLLLGMAVLFAMIIVF